MKERLVGVSEETSTGVVVSRGSIKIMPMGLSCSSLFMSMTLSPRVRSVYVFFFLSRYVCDFFLIKFGYGFLLFWVKIVAFLRLQILEFGFRSVVRCGCLETSGKWCCCASSTVSPSRSRLCKWVAEPQRVGG